jgi:hypothetical protein
MRILLVADNFYDGIAFYRSTGPWNEILKEFDDITVTRANPKEYFGWDIYTSYDVLFISNPRQVKHAEIIRTARLHNVKVWADYDDCYLDIPEENQSFNVLTAGHVDHFTKECLMESDVITVTTPYLKEVFSQYNSNIHVIPNGFPIGLLSNNSLGEITQGIHNFVSWRGSISHEVNLMEYKEEIEEVGKSNPHWAFKFFGMKPKFFSRSFNFQHLDFLPLIDSIDRLKRFSSKVHIVTLYERPFNLSKSNIAWIEATISGSVVLAPDWEEWRRPGVVNYTSKEDFKNKLNEMLSEGYDLTSRFEQSKEYVLNNLSLKKINKERIKILKTISCYKE